jgi:hypothetical protein
LPVIALLPALGGAQHARASELGATVVIGGAAGLDGLLELVGELTTT